MLGRRRPDTPHGDVPEDIRAGDYWKVINTDGTVVKSSEESNLTGRVWMIATPIGEGYSLATLTKHTVREEEDGTISIRSGDGSSNSIFVTRGGDQSWHGYIEHGVWNELGE